ncbi:MAG: cupin domain-containing protein [Burkholderiales bacterium]
MIDPRDDDSLMLDDAAMLAESLKPQSPAPDRAQALKARILAGVRAEAAGRAGESPPAADERDAIVLPPARDAGPFLTIHAKDRAWVRVGPGVEMCTLLEEADRRSILLRMQPGSFLPPHRHEMAEESLLLEGDARIGSSTYLTAGDYHHSPAGAVHPVLESPHGCVVFVRCERGFHPRVTVGLLKRLLQGVVGKSPD